MKCVNALNGLLLISTNKLKRKEAHNMKCVNALNGLLLISTNEKDFLAGTLLVSMPSTSFYSFLR